jgi:hypothetical protein
MNEVEGAVTKHLLYDDFTEDAGPTFAATRLVKDLIQLSNLDVCQLKRNALTLYLLLGRATAVYKATNILIQTVDTEEVDSWVNFDKYVAAINPLELCVPITLSIPALMRACA